ncbi:MAG: fibronectin type III domain-containing protein [bacterium]
MDATAARGTRDARDGSAFRHAAALAVLAVAIVGAAAHAATTLDATPATITVEQTSAAATVEIDVAVNSVTDLTAWQFHVRNPSPDPGTQPRVTAVAAGDWWQGADDVFASASHDWGYVLLGYEYPTVAGKTGSGNLAHITISYANAAPGSYDFTIDHEELVDTAASVIPVTVTGFTLVIEAPQAPQPDPPVLAITGKTTTSVAMECSECTDTTGPVEYQFNKDLPSPGATFRDWAATRTAEDTALTANKQYVYRARARDATDEQNTTGWSTDVATYTLPVPPDVACDRASPGDYPVGTLFTFSNLAGWGEGALDHYRYAWNTQATYTFAGTEATWDAGDLALTADVSDNWYLHVMSQNPDDESGGTATYGPYSVGAPPAAPTAFAHLANTTDSITWTWTDNSSDETGFRVEDVGLTVGPDVTTCTEDGLDPNTPYTRYVVAYNAYGDSDPSNDHTAYTSIQTPTGVSFAAISNTSIELAATGTLSNLTSASSGAYFTETGGHTTGIAEWVQVATDTATGLTPNTQYTFHVKARNGDGDQTPESPTAQAYTHASPPGAEALTNISASGIQANWNAGTPANPAGTLYLVECYQGPDFTGAKVGDSGWTTDLSHAFAGLDPNTQYSFRVKAKNAEDVETAWTQLGSATTLANAPGPLAIQTQVFDGATLRLDAPACRSLGILSIDLNGNPADTPIAIKVQGGGWLRFVDDGSGHTDVYADGLEEDWHTAAEWATKRLRGLAPATLYAFEAKAQNAVGQETALAAVGTYDTHDDGDVNGDGDTTVQDLVYVRDAVLTGGDVGADYSWATDINDDDLRQTDVSDISAVQSIILNP